jgi:hypothetical protein
MHIAKTHIIIVLFIIIFVLFIYYNQTNSENFTSNICPNNCIRESKNDNLINMCTQSCYDIYKKCPENCNIFCEHDATGTCLPHCRNKCGKELTICLQKCKCMQPKYI